MCATVAALEALNGGGTELAGPAATVADVCEVVARDVASPRLAKMLDTSPIGADEAQEAGKLAGALAWGSAEAARLNTNSN